MSKIANLGRVSLKTATDAVFNDTLYEDYDVIKFELAEAVNCLDRKNLRDRVFTMTAICDYLHGIRTEPPLPLAFFINDDRVLESGCVERGLEFADPLPICALPYCNLTYTVPTKSVVKYPVTIIRRCSYVKGPIRDDYRHNLITIELTNGTKLEVANGTVNILEANTPDVKRDV